MAQHAAHRRLVRVEEQGAEHGVEVFFEREVEHEIERIPIAREFGDGLLLELLALRLDDVDLVPFAVEQSEVRRPRNLIAQCLAERFFLKLAAKFLSFKGNAGCQLSSPSNTYGERSVKSIDSGHHHAAPT